MAIERGPATPSALRELTTSAISNTIGVSACDVFVYDTRKDSDGGAWRKRCQHTSWYNETLGTATRGVRRDFPAVAVIVATQNDVTIYDGDDPDLPMWMVFTAVNQGVANTSMIQIPGNNRTVYMLNGILIEATQNEGANYGNPVINFISEKVVRMDSQAGGSEGGTWSGYIVDRNTTTKGYNSSSEDYAIKESQVNRIAMTVLPGAPIDPTTGLPIPTIALAHQSGVTIIHNNGTVATIADGENNDSVHRIVFTDDNRLAFTYSDNASNAYGFAWVGEIPTTSYTSGTMYGFSNPATTIMSEHYNYAGDSGAGSGSGYSMIYPTKPKSDISSAITGLATYGNRTMSIGSGVGLSNIMRPTPHVARAMNGASNEITTTYNSGWMYGDIRGAWLSDSVTETLVGSGELITNGTFDSNVSGWTAYNSTIALSSNTMQVTRSGGSGPAAYQTITCVPGKTYTLSAVINSAGSRGDLIVYSSLASGGVLVLQGTSGQTVSLCGSFVATQTTYWIQVAIDSNGTSVYVDNVSCRLSDPDRSVNTRGLQVYGSLTKSAIATGTDLVAYSGFSAGNYLVQPYTPAMDIGTGSYSVMFWYKTTSAGGVFSRGPTDPDEMSRIRIEGSTYGIYFDYGSGSQYCYLTTSSDRAHLLDGNWKFVVCAVTAGGYPAIYVNGKPMAITTSAQAPITFTTSASYATYVGSEYGTGFYFPGSLALFRYSASVPTADQVYRIYNDEKSLFQAGAKGCLYGSSDAVTALAYDDSTQLLHVGTSSGRSTFDGIRRVENTTTAVSTAISASNGLVVEQ
jgi:trimeric autotransporter adhesin